MAASFSSSESTATGVRFLIRTEEIIEHYWREPERLDSTFGAIRFLYWGPDSQSGWVDFSVGPYSRDSLRAQVSPGFLLHHLIDRLTGRVEHEREIRLPRGRYNVRLEAGIRDIWNSSRDERRKVFQLSIRPNSTVTVRVFLSRGKLDFFVDPPEQQ